MCIRDSYEGEYLLGTSIARPLIAKRLIDIVNATGADAISHCLLYTSDAADERSSVDLGGRRIIKKKNDVMIAITGGMTK